MLIIIHFLLSPDLRDRRGERIPCDFPVLSTRTCPCLWFWTRGILCPPPWIFFSWPIVWLCLSSVVKTGWGLWLRSRYLWGEKNQRAQWKNSVEEESSLPKACQEGQMRHVWCTALDGGKRASPESLWQLLSFSCARFKPFKVPHIWDFRFMPPLASYIDIQKIQLPQWSIEQRLMVLLEVETDIF